MTEFKGEQLSLVGLNLQAVMNLKDLPSELINQFSSLTSQLSDYSQLVLIGHGGKLLWQKVKESGFRSDNTIDDYSREHVAKFFVERFSANDFRIIFPSNNTNQSPLGLQKLGEIAGWHNQSPFRVGINHQWGSWFAYRAVVLVKSDYPVTQKLNADAPCLSCQERPCIPKCPANALVGDGLDLKACIAYRKQTESKCRDRCIARMACPVANKHQYNLEQTQYHYSLSMRMIEDN